MGAAIRVCTQVRVWRGLCRLVVNLVRSWHLFSLVGVCALTRTLSLVRSVQPHPFPPIGCTMTNIDATQLLFPRHRCAVTGEASARFIDVRFLCFVTLPFE